MRASACRALSAAFCLCLLGAATGCSTATKRHYLEHLSITLAPSRPDRQLALDLAEARAAASGTAFAGVDTDE